MRSVAHGLATNARAVPICRFFRGSPEFRPVLIPPAPYSSTEITSSRWVHPGAYHGDDARSSPLCRRMCRHGAAGRRRSGQDAVADLGPIVGAVGRTCRAQRCRAGARNAGRLIGRPRAGASSTSQNLKAAAYWPWLARTCWQAWLIFGRLACRQPRMPSVSSGLTFNWLWQNLVTSGWQAARSLSLPWFVAGGGCGGNVWAFTAATAKTKAIDIIDIRIMVPPFAGIRPGATRSI